MSERGVKILSAEVHSDPSDILARKPEGRRTSSGLSFGEKTARMEAPRQRLSPFGRFRESRIAKGPQRSASN